MLDPDEDAAWEPELDDSEEAERNRLARLDAVRSRMRKISNSATSDAPVAELPEPNVSNDDRLALIRASRVAKWDEKVPPKWKWCEIKQLPGAMKTEAINWITKKYPNGENLILLGPTGSGKTSLAYAIAKEVYVGGSKVKIWQTAALMDELRPGETSRIVFESAKNCDLLVLDDLGAEKESEWTEERLYVIIDWRWQYNLPTIVASNLNEVALAERLSDRIYSRLMHGAEITVINGEDYRNTHG